MIRCERCLSATGVVLSAGNILRRRERYVGVQYVNLLICTIISVLTLEDSLFLLLAVGSSRFSFVDVAFLPAVADEITFLVAMTGG